MIRSGMGISINVHMHGNFLNNLGLYSFLKVTSTLTSTLRLIRLERALSDIRVVQQSVGSLLPSMGHYSIWHPQRSVRCFEMFVISSTI